jgi:hypothetical protein
MLTEAQCREFLENGFTLVDDLLPMNVIEAASASQDELYKGEKKNGIIGYCEGEGLEMLYQQKNLEDTAKAVLRADAVELISGASLYTLPSDTNDWFYDENGAHVDIQYNRNDLDSTPLRMSVMFMIFLDDVEETCAPTVVSPGSHQLVADWLGDRPPYQDRPTNIKDLPDLDFADMIPACGRKGQVMVSTTSLLHCGSINTTDHPRKVLFVAFAPKGLNIRFNTNREHLRLKFLENIRDRFPAERRYIVESTIEGLKSVADVPSEL